MNICFVAKEDSAGVLAELKRGINKYSDHDAFLITQWEHPYEYGNEDFVMDKDPDNSEIDDLMKSIDVFHVNETIKCIPELERYMLKTPFVVEHHGTALRNNWIKFNSLYAKRPDIPVFVSTCDLMAYLPDCKSVQWLPNPVDCNDIKVKKDVFEGDKFIVSHFPSNPIKKGSLHIVNAAQQLETKGLKIGVDLKSNIPHKEVQNRIAKSHVLFDKLLYDDGYGYYGCTGIEALAHGVPVLINEFIKFTTNHPFIIIDRSNIMTQLQILYHEWMAKSDAYAHYCKASRVYAETIHNTPLIVDKIVKTYEEIGANAKL